MSCFVLMEKAMLVWYQVRALPYRPTLTVKTLFCQSHKLVEDSYVSFQPISVVMEYCQKKHLSIVFKEAVVERSTMFGIVCCIEKRKSISWALEGLRKMLELMLPRRPLLLLRGNLMNLVSNYITCKPSYSTVLL